MSALTFPSSVGIRCWLPPIRYEGPQTRPGGATPPLPQCPPFSSGLRRDAQAYRPILSTGPTMTAPPTMALTRLRTEACTHNATTPEPSNLVPISADDSDSPAAPVSGGSSTFKAMLCFVYLWYITVPGARERSSDILQRAVSRNCPPEQRPPPPATPWPNSPFPIPDPKI